MSLLNQTIYNAYSFNVAQNSTDSNDSSITIIGNVMVWGLIIGTLLSYTPQYYKIYKSRTTKGVSEKSIIFGVYSCIFNVLGTVQQDYKRLHDCSKNNNCYDAFIPIVQLCSPFLCMLLLYWFYLKYISGEYSLVNLTNGDERILVDTYLKRQAVYRRGRYNLFVCAFITTLSLIINTLGTEYHIVSCGKIFNVISAILSVVMWIPQIVKTYELKSAHALSLIALSIHSFGCFITIIYQGVIMKQNFLVVSNYLIGGICEGSIVLMVLYYRRQARKFKTEMDMLHEDLGGDQFYNSCSIRDDYESHVVTL